jgi:hypothetical protein
MFKTYGDGPWPSLLFENDVSLKLFKRPTFSERIFKRPLMHTKYLTIGYHVSGEKYTSQAHFLGHITTFLSPYQLQLKMHFKNTFQCPYHILRV